MLKRFLAVLGMFLSLFALVACTENEPISNDSAISTPTMFITDPVSAEIVTPTPNLSASHQIIFAMYIYGPEQENQEKINRLLIEKGYDCTVKFVGMGVPVNQGMYECVESWERNGNKPDIFSAGVWSSGMEAKAFAEKQFVPLNGFLESEDGQRLYSYYCRGDWDEVTSADGIIYTLPRQRYRTTEYSNFNKATWLTINNRYLEYFTDFDGTYLSLRHIYDEIKDDDLVIELANADDSLLFGMMGYQTYYGYPYDSATHCFVNPASDECFKCTLEQLWEDINNGITDVAGIIGPKPEQLLACVHEGPMQPKEGYSEILMTEDAYHFNVRMCYGVSKDSEQKELAMHVLAALFSDPEIARLLIPQFSDFALLDEERIELTKKCKAMDFARFETSYTPEEEYRMVQYSCNFESRMLATNKTTHELMINEEFRPQDIFEIYTSDEYHKILSELNHMMELHLSEYEGG